MDNWIIQMEGITKVFSNIIANDNINFQLKKGEIHAVLGENGAGKSTLMSVLFGLYQPEKGVIKVHGKVVKISGPLQANALGIGMVHQHFKLVHNFTVLENIMLGMETTRKGFLQRNEAREKIQGISEKYQLNVDLNAYISHISVGMQQRVEILKMLYRNNDILIFDEPTAVLMPQEIEELLNIMKDLAREGKSILFITHKLKEIKKIAHRCTVLRQGKNVGTFLVKGTSQEVFSEMMVGRKLDLQLFKRPHEPGPVLLEIDNVWVKSKREGNDKWLVKQVNFQIRGGEILCIAGIDGNGQRELVEVVTGLSAPSIGKIILKGEDVTKKSIRYRNTHGMSHVPEDRQKHGLVLDFSLVENIGLQEYFTNNFQKHGFIDYKKMKSYTRALIQKYDIRSGGEETVVRDMSGGNQQKVIIARELSREPDVLVAVQPTRGLDIGAISSVHKALLECRDRGKAVLLISLELEEVMNLSDRILVIYEGKVLEEFKSEEVTLQELGLCMAGTKRRSR